jgi:bifunctional UDP-N-acetylglucosamine pyrophosphorylase/glucosamine-1-phosphate N-acetyltransferase
MASAAARDLAVVILAAGQGTRMRSARNKVLHEIAGRPMLGFALAAAESLRPERLGVVVGNDAEEVREAFAGRASFVLQAEQRGTGHAVLQAQDFLAGFAGDVLILYGDTPLLRAETLKRMQERRDATGAELVLLSAMHPLPGRIVRDAEGRVERIVETPDATPEELLLKEGNTGVYLLSSQLLEKGLSQLDDRNAQGELYLTDVVGYAIAEGLPVEAMTMDDPEEALGVNTRAELAQAAAALRRRKNGELMEAGVTLVDPAHTYIDVDVEIGRDSLLEPGCTLSGDTRLGEGVVVRAGCVVESSWIGDDVSLGPMAHIRPGCRIERGARIGNFVEVKNSHLGEGVKADHLAYIGDADVGAGAAFGCGAITVNYDWDAKHRTQVDEGANIGCNANLVAPVRVGKDSAVAAGSTVTGDVPDGALAVERGRQRNVEGWRERRRSQKKQAD